ncbi:MAG: hypothetical protein M0Z91_06150, partial [Actinomycetota bacterium]|nr:hypothetical protein [Actinomycetota bacterium]
AAATYSAPNLAKRSGCSMMMVVTAGSRRSPGLATFHRGMMTAMFGHRGLQWEPEIMLRLPAYGVAAEAAASTP